MPTSFLASHGNAERFLFLAAFGIAAGIGSALSDIGERSHRLTSQASIVVLMACWIQSTMLLSKHRTEWSAAADAALRLIEATELVLPKSGPSKVEFVNVPKGLHGKPVLGNGIGGALMASGYSKDLIVIVNYDTAAPAVREQKLIGVVRECAMTEPANVLRILLAINSVVTDHTGQCALNAINEDSRVRPLAWEVDTGEEASEVRIPLRP